jgi:hypothetical protein
MNVYEEVEREAELVMVSQIVVNFLYDSIYPAGDRDKRVEPCLDLVTRTLPGLPVSCKKAIWLVTGDLVINDIVYALLTVIESTGNDSEVYHSGTRMETDCWLWQVASLGAPLALDAGHESATSRVHIFHRALTGYSFDLSQTGLG